MQPLTARQLAVDAIRRKHRNPQGDTVDLQEALEADNVRPGGTCAFARLFDGLPTPEADILRNALNDPNITHRRLARAITNAHGEQFGKVSDFTVSRHRRNDCTCR